MFREYKNKMKKKDLSEIKSKTISQLMKNISDLKKEMVGLSIDMSLGKTKNVHELSKKKKNIAQIKTILNQKLALEKKVKAPKVKKEEK